MTASQKKAAVADQHNEVKATGVEADTPTSKPTKAKAKPVKTPKANAYTETEDALLLALVAEHGRADGLRLFVQQNGHRTQYGAECRLHRLTKKAAG
jgi:hypothetical protein